VDFSVAANAGHNAHEIITVPLVATFQQQVLPQAGTYDIALTIDGKHARTVQFQAGLTPKATPIMGSAKG
jgi:hypothetical protein